MSESNKSSIPKATILKVRTKVARQMVTLGGERITQKGTVVAVFFDDYGQERAVVHSHGHYNLSPDGYFVTLSDRLDVIDSF